MSQNILRKVSRPRSNTVGGITDRHLKRNAAGPCTKIELIYPWLDLDLKPSKIQKWKPPSFALRSTNLDSLKRTLIVLSKPMACTATEEDYLDDEHYYYVDGDVPESSYEGLEPDEDLYKFWHSL